jgi:glycosyltransferase involved in cell wall biosynthesis
LTNGVLGVVKKLIFVFPGDLASLTGGYAYDRRVIEGLQTSGWQIQLISLGEGYPFPTKEQLDKAASLLLQLEAGVPMLVDGLALGVLPDLAPLLAARHPLVGLVHHPLAFESGLSPEQVRTLQESEKKSLMHAKKVVANSPKTARDLTGFYGVPVQNVTVVLPGTDRCAVRQIPALTRRPSSGPVQLLSVGSVIPRKGFHILVEALQPLKSLSWRLTIAGDVNRDAPAYAHLKEVIHRCSLQDRVHVLGAVSSLELQNLYAKSDVFVLASFYEGYGMVFAEAMANGLPIVSTTGGAIADTVPKQAGVLVEPGQVDALSDAIKLLIENDDYRSSLAQGARSAAQQQPTWEESVQKFDQLLSELTAE